MGDSVSAAAAQHAEPAPRWDAWRLLRGVAPRGAPVLDRRALFESSALTLSDAMLRGTELGVHRAGAHGAWDLPYRVGPGIDRFSLWFDGLPVQGGACAEANLHTLSPALLSELHWLPPSPFLDPLAASADGMLWGATPQADPAATLSAVRLCEGAGGVGTQEFWLTRAAAAWRLTGAYAHSSGEGRPAWVEPRYTGTQYQNLLANLDRGARWGVLRLSVAGRDGKWTMEGPRKLVWESQQGTIGWQSPDSSRCLADVRLVRRNDLLRWWAPEGDARRRTTETALLARGFCARGSLRLLWAGAAERVAADLRLGGGYDRSWTADGIGLATGVVWSDSLQRLRGVVGYTEPWWGAGHLRAEFSFARRLRRALGVHLEAWRNEAVAFTPRLEGDGEALLAEGLVLPGARDPEEVRQRRREHLALDLRAASGDRALCVGLFVDRIAGALGLDPDAATLLAPEVRDTTSLERLLDDATLGGARCTARLPLWWGAEIGGDLTWIFSPQEDALPVLTPRIRGRARFSLAGRLFQDDLAWEGRLICVGRSGWTTGHGWLEELARFDGELHATIGAAHLFLALRNLTNADQPSATYADGRWAPLMLRSYQAGFEWRFRD
ncbi:MAG: hypothetical protein GF330_14430 [Candidatus Eisenbacteria bacterium]|nr:hypothetical protein [Candidatus Eisenbacteria bacterium]